MSTANQETTRQLQCKNVINVSEIYNELIANNKNVVAHKTSKHVHVYLFNEQQAIWKTKAMFEYPSFKNLN